MTSYREMLEGLIERSRSPERISFYEAELAVPPMPMELGYLWRAFNRIRHRKGNGFGPCPIEWPDIDAFVRNSRFCLAPWEIEVIEELDDLYMAEQAKVQRDRMQAKT
jgi:hypothetical protein